jgi:Phage P22-like portal protein
VSRTKAAIWMDVHDRAIKRFEQTYKASQEARLLCVADRRFVNKRGAMWGGPEAKLFDSKPRFEFNKIYGAISRAVSEYRNNRVTVSFTPPDDADKQMVELAEQMNSYFRECEHASSGQDAFDNGFEEAYTGGIGGWRLVPCYEDEDDEENEHQTIRLESIPEADQRLFLDNGALREDKSDGKWGFLLTPLSEENYTDEYGDDMASFERGRFDAEVFDWRADDVVWVAEYFEVEEKRRKVQMWVSITGEEQRHNVKTLEEDPGIAARLTALGWKMSYERTLKEKCVRKYIINGAEVLEDCGLIPGPNIPLVQTNGRRTVIDGVEHLMGEVRLSMDAQRLKNMQLSKLAEISALSAVEKPYFTPSQVKGHEKAHSEDSVNNAPYLLLNPVIDPITGAMLPAQPIAYTKPPQVPQALAALLQMTDMDMADILGRPQEADKLVSNISGEAVDMIQTRVDAKTFVYTSNHAKALKRTGVIFLGMVKALLTEEGRKVKGIGKSGESKVFTLFKQSADVDTKAVTMSGDTTKADKLECVVDVGPSSTSKRASTVRALTGMIGVTQDPETLKILNSAVMLNMEGEGLEDMRPYFRKQLVQMGALEPNEEEKIAMAQAQANAKPDPNAVYLEAMARKADADGQLSMAKIEETKAKIMQLLDGVETANVQQVIALLDAMNQPAVPAPT